MKNTIIVIMVLGLLVVAGCSLVTKKVPSQPVAPEQLLPATTGEQPPRMCTMEYMPVCGVDGQTYGNKCTAGDVPIAYQGECNVTKPSSMPPLDPSMCENRTCPIEPIALEPEGQLVGNDRDEHGCIGSAGYSWCEATQKCIRPWEEQC